MPEIGEVARIVHHLKKSLVGKTLKTVKAQDDSSVFGKVGTSAAEFEKALTGKKVVDAGQQGKYFWLIMSSPPHPVMHFGMTGWLQIKGEHTYYYKPKKGEEIAEWPPKYWKFAIETAEQPVVEAAFSDARRFSRIRLVHCDAKDIRKTTPLKENGPDPVLDEDILTEEWLKQKMRKKHVPVKALLLDQANISGIGNWVGDEIMYHARLHPEQYSDTFSDEQLSRLHKSILHVCKVAVDLLADSDQFPDDWLFKHRWGKGKKDPKLPNGAKITFLTVGGRTSAVVPSVQKKTGAVAGDVKTEDSNQEDEEKPAKGKGKNNNNEPKTVEKLKGAPPTGKERQKKNAVKEEPEEEEEDVEDVKPKTKKRKADPEPKEAKKAKTNGVNKEPEVMTANDTGRRRSGRVMKGKA